MKFDHKYSYKNIKNNYNCLNMKVLNLRDFEKKYNLKNDIMKESE